MGWLDTMATGLAAQNVSGVKTDDTAEIAGAGVVGIGGALAGMAVGAAFGPVGIAIGLYAGSKLGAEGGKVGVRGVKDFLGKL